ncbi:hypothetical protein [Nocardioides lacusdianchii]|uniref:hypothetical protein n=1 Tax=Nocardioides lacusdianchii TaxID=2783664 RepID=UPI001CCB2671|nr:hypothetical protein [Nocardioides lacusdianchii]
MTDHRPPACHYDRHLGERVTGEHRDDCPNPTGHRGCVPCTAPHCVVCGRNHATNDQPLTCPTCQHAVDQDLKDITTAYDELAAEATDGGGDGRLVAAAPIPGGTAQVLRGPTVLVAAMRTYAGYTDENYLEDHHASDPLPPLAVLAHWEDQYRTWLGHTPAAIATVGSCVDYLRTQLPHLAQQPDGPDWPAFTREVRDLRARLERALHDEREPERGVECFECGDTLQRRWRRPARCTHSTPARRELRRWARLGYPEALTVADVRAAYVPCGKCDQGGIEDPSAGQSWECPGCRKAYDPGEYATAVRRDLLTKGANGDGWTHVSMAATAASEITDGLVLAGTVRKWMDRNKVASCCVWEPGKTWGMRLVFWPDVADAALDLNRRVAAARLEQQRRAREHEAWSDAVSAGEDPKAAGVRLGLAPARVRSFIEEHDRLGA